MTAEGPESGEAPPPSGSSTEVQATEASGHVFVSYASKDAAVASALVQSLERHGVRCWIAPRDVKAGALYADAIVRAISSAEALVLILSACAIASSHVSKEVERASSKRRPVIALRIDDAPLSPALEYFLGESHWIDARAGGMDAALAKLIAEIREPERIAPGIIATVASGTPAGTAPAAQTKSHPMLVLLISALCMFGAVLAWFAIDKFRFSGRIETSSNIASTQPTAVSTAAMPATATASFTPPPQSIAVLPFVNMSGDSKQEYLSDGFSEELLNSLTRMNNLQVVARTSSFAFKGQSVDISTIAHKLNVGAVLEGSVRRVGNTMRVTAQLINAVTGFHIWSETYDRKFGDILKIQTEVAAAVAQQLQVRLVGGESAKLDVGGTKNPEAYDAYLRAVRQLRDGDQSPTETRAVLTSTDRVIELDPRYAATYAFRSYLFISLSRSEPNLDKRTHLRDQAAASAERAIVLAPEFARAHAALGFVRLIGFWDFGGASLEIERALALAPGDSTLNADFGLFEAQLRHFDAAIEATSRAVSLDPQDWLTYRQQALVFYYARRFADAEVAIRHALSLKPDSHGVNGLQIRILIGAGDVQQSLRLCESSTTLLDDDDRHYFLALI